jgi:hypothetical protein
MTLRRRSPGLLREMANLPRSAWRTIQLDVPHRIYQAIDHAQAGCLILAASD